MKMLTVIVPCFNEEAVIRDCLESVRFADEVLVVDSFSTDRTLEIASKYADRVLQHEYINSAAQKNWALDLVKTPWVLIVDADERVTPELAAEIKSLLSNPTCDGYWIYRRIFFLGREVKHGAWKMNKVLRLFRPEKGRYQIKHVHAEVELKGSEGYCKGMLDHYSYRNFDDFLRKAARYGTWGALNARDKGIRASGWRIFGHTTAHFFKSYFLRQGFRDGSLGFIVAFMEAIHSFLKYGKLYELQAKDTKSLEQPASK